MSSHVTFHLSWYQVIFFTQASGSAPKCPPQLRLTHPKFQMEPQSHSLRGKPFYTTNWKFHVGQRAIYHIPFYVEHVKTSFGRFTSCINRWRSQLNRAAVPPCFGDRRWQSPWNHAAAGTGPQKTAISWRCSQKTILPASKKMELWRTNLVGARWCPTVS